MFANLHVNSCSGVGGVCAKSQVVIKSHMVQNKRGLQYSKPSVSIPHIYKSHIANNVQGEG